MLINIDEIKVKIKRKSREQRTVEERGRQIAGSSSSSGSSGSARGGATAADDAADEVCTARMISGAAS